MADGVKLPPCVTCGSEVRVLTERDRLVFYICDVCGARGAVDLRGKPTDDDRDRTR